MYLLFIASFIWAFSFGLIKGSVPKIDPYVLSVVRILIAFALSLLFHQHLKFKPAAVWRLYVGGFLQLGVMYAPYMLSFKYLQAHEVALFTMTSPLYFAAFDMLLRRFFSIKFFVAAVLAVLGGGIVAWKSSDFSGVLTGALLVQLSNVFFTLGQWFVVRNGLTSKDEFLPALPHYFGGALVGALVCLLVFGSDLESLTDSLRVLSASDWSVLIWLGAAATGAGFVVWNLGAVRVLGAQLAVAMDFKLPIAIAVSLVFFGEQADIVNLVTGAVILAAAAKMVQKYPT
jgi:drug/metabolite transporter (DMT)-like permease